jgi:hypothetical protein
MREQKEGGERSISVEKVTWLQNSVNHKREKGQEQQETGRGD